MTESEKICALVPIKEFARAKSRLGGVLTAGQCAELAACMTGDVIDALLDCERIERIACLGAGEQTAEFANSRGCAFIDEIPGSDLSANLDLAARRLQDEGAETLLILPGDLPMLTSADIEMLLAGHNDDLTICRAQRDGGTNALVVSPPTGIRFRFGESSCARHAEAAKAAGLTHRIVNAPAFGHDIDTPDDLTALCRSAVHGETGRYLDRSGLRSAAGSAPAHATA